MSEEVQKRKYRVKGKEKDKPRAAIDEFDEATRAEYERIYAKAKKTNIITMREEARKMGLKSATTFEKERLTEIIALAHLHNTVLKVEIAGIPQPVSQEERLLIVDDYVGKTRVLDPVDVEGVVCFDDNMTAWLRPKFVRDDYKDTFLSMRLVNDFKLKAGDYVKGLGRGLTGAQRYAIYKLETINGIAANDFERPECPKRVVAVQGEDRKTKLAGGHELMDIMDKSPVIKGEAKFYIGTECRYMGDHAREIAKSFIVEGYHPVTILLDERPGAIVAIEKLPGMWAALDAEQSLNADDAVNSAINHVKVLCSMGKNMALIINNADTLGYSTLTAALNSAGLYTEGSITVVLTTSVLGTDPKVSRLARMVDSVHFVD